MFSDAGKKARVYHNESEGLWALHISTPQYWTWKKWMCDQLGYSRRVQSQWLTVWDEWPPITQADAMRVAKIISDMRDDLRIPVPVPRKPQPWNCIRVKVPEEYREGETP